jgi:hypothetical protein
MFRITLDESSGSDNLYLIEITYNGSNVLIMCVVGVWWQNVVKLQKQTAERMLKLGVVSEHNMCFEHTRDNSFNSRNRHSKYFLTANSSVSVSLLQICNKLTLQGASAVVGNTISHIPTVLQATLMHLLKQANIFTGTTLRLDIYLLLRLVKSSNKSE